MNYNKKNNICQLTINKNLNQNETSNNYLRIPCDLERFVNTSTDKINKNDKTIYHFHGYVELDQDELICSHCGGKIHIHQSYPINVKHIPIGGNYSSLIIEKHQLMCNECGATKMQNIPFLYKNHAITNVVKNYICDLLSTNKFTNTDIAEITGVNRNLVKEIDKERLQKLYTLNGDGNIFIKPENYAKYLGIDEFKLHKGYIYATHIIDYATGHIIWIAKGKKKQVVYDFIDHVGLEWMSHVEAVACDMNSDFEEAFKDKCSWITIVYDYFHIVKNFNEKVINKVRIEEQERLKKEGKEEEAKKLKHSKYILCSNEETLAKKDKEAEESKIIQKESKLFNTNEVKRKGGKLQKLYELINNNEILLLIEIIKEILIEAYKCNNKEEMEKLIFEIMELCEESKNKYLLWFKNLLYNHYDGIISHATIKISSGKIEGINNKIKTARRQAYGYPDDEYFFLKVVDLSRH